MQDLSAIALSDLPLVGQQALAKHPAMNVKTLLASSNLTHPSVLDKLLKNNSLVSAEGQQMREYAATRTTQAKLVATIWSTQLHVQMYPARNPLMASDNLVQALKNPARNIALSAYLNPATPERARRKLKPNRAAHIINDETGNGHTAIRAFTLVSANPWMQHQPTRWSPTIQRAMVWQPEASIETLRALSALGEKEAERHPTFYGTEIHSLTVKQLLATESVAAITAAIRKPEFTLADGARILRNVPRPEQHIVGELVNRYGLSALMADTRTVSFWGTSSCAAARWVAYSLHYVNNICTEQCVEAAEVISILGDNQQHWESFVTLTTDWYGDLREAAKTACRL